MATKADLIKKAKKAGIEVDDSMTVDQIKAAIAGAEGDGGDTGASDAEAAKAVDDEDARSEKNGLPVFLSNDKKVRAMDVVKGRRQFGEDAVETRALKQCEATGAKGNDLIVCVYRKLGGACAGDPRGSVDTREGEISVKKSGKEEESLPEPA